MLANTYRRQLRDKADQQFGYVTTHDARQLGIPSVELRKIAARGGLTHVAWGLYRFDDAIRSNRDHYMEAVLRVGPEAYLAGESVLALHDLALLNPPTIQVATSRRVRHHLPKSIEVVVDDAEPSEITSYDGIPGVTMLKAFRDCSTRVMNSRLRDAIDMAEVSGLLTRINARTLRAELRSVRKK